MQPVNSVSPNEIIAKLAACGHFIHFKMGGKAGRQRIYSTLLKHGELQQRELQSILGIRSGSLSEILAKAEADGFVEKTRNGLDKRNYNLRLTEMGKEYTPIVQEAHDVRVEKLLGCLSEEQKMELSNMLAVLLNHWDTIEQEIAWPAEEKRTDKNKYEKENNE